MVAMVANTSRNAAQNVAGTRAALKPTRDPSPRSTLHLKTAEDVRLEQAKVYRDARAGRLDPKTACQLTYVLGEIRRSIETTIIEAQVIELKARHERLMLPGSALGPLRDQSIDASEG